jgi:hypothetical protein
MAPPPLPEELLIRICSYLCFHCQNPDDFINPDVPSVWESKATLARVCLASKRMLGIAQPVLYHYYATGNIPGPIYSRREADHGYPCADDKLPAFLCTLIRCPILATYVRSLQLQEIHNPGVPAIGFSTELLHLFTNTSETLGIEPPIWAQSVIDRSLPPPFYKGQPGRRIYIDFWLRELIIALTPRTEKIIYGHSRYMHLVRIKPSKRLLPALKSLAFRSGGTTYKLDGMLELIRMAPNLTSLYVIGSHSWNGEGLPERSSALPQLQKLVVEGLEVPGLNRLLRWQGQLRDLEYYSSGVIYGEEFVLALSPVKDVLTRLCYGSIFANAHVDVSDDRCAEHWIRMQGIYSTMASLKEFSRLRELIVDQAALYYRHEHGQYVAQRLVRLLPVSIESVHLTYVFTSIHGELLQLALAKPNKFPKLRHLKIGIVDRCQPDRQAGLEQMRTVEADFAAVGVQMEWSVDRCHADSNTVIPGGTVSAASIPLPTAPRRPR